MELLYELFRDAARQGYLPDAFEHAFMVRALVAALIIAPLLGGMGTLIVSRKLAFFTQTIGHASLTGVALGLLLGEPLNETYAGLYGFSLLAAILMMYLRNRTAAASDTVIGVVLAQTLGLGILMLVLVTQRFDVHQVEALLFGSLLTLAERDLVVIGLVGMLAIPVLIGTFNPFMLLCFSPSLARARGARPLVVEYLFVLTATLVVVASLKLIGALLVLALVVVPAAAAGNVAGGLRSYFWLSVFFATFSTLAGLFLTSLFPVPTGAAIVLCASVVFYLTWVAKVMRASSSLVQGEY